MSFKSTTNNHLSSTANNRHQPQLSVNSIQSLVEPVTPPPLGQLNIKNHQKSQSLDLSGFNQFINNSSIATNFNSNSNILNIPTSLTPISMNNNKNLPNNNNTNNNNTNSTNNNSIVNLNSNSALPLINEFSGSLNDAIKNNSLNQNTSSNSSYNNGSNNHNIQNTKKKNSMDLFNSTPSENLDYLKLATDQFGCRFLQKKLESNSINESNLVRDLMFDQIKPFLLNLILDPFGNYLIQKLCEYLTVDQKTTLIDSIYPYIYKISINQYGTRSLQKIIDTVDNENQMDLLIKGFSSEFISIEQIVLLINDLNGNHVIQKCIFKFPSSKFDFIINAIVEKNNIITISTHKHGCCVLQKLLSVCTLQQIFTISLKIIQFLPGLINDQFGNYIIQFLLNIKELDFYFLIEIFNKLNSNLCQLSCLKFSSNVIEKFIKKLFGVIIGSMKGEFLININDEVVNNIMNILLNIVDIFTINLNILIKDNFGNYALQTLLDVKTYNIMIEYPDNTFLNENNQKYNSFCHDFTLKITNLVLLTKDLLPSIKTTSYAKKIKLKVKSYIELTGLTSNDALAKEALAAAANVNLNYNSNSVISYNTVIPKQFQEQPQQSVPSTLPLPKSSQFQSSSPSSSSTLSLSQQQSQQYKQHQRHFSLPANSFHRRTSSTTSFANNLNTHSNLLYPQNNSVNLNNSMTNIFNSTNTSPLNHIPQHMNPNFALESSSFMNNDICVPLRNLSLSSESSHAIFMNDPMINSNINMNNNNDAMSNFSQNGVILTSNDDNDNSSNISNSGNQFANFLHNNSNFSSSNGGSNVITNNTLSRNTMNNDFLSSNHNGFCSKYDLSLQNSTMFKSFDVNANKSNGNNSQRISSLPQPPYFTHSNSNNTNKDGCYFNYNSSNNGNVNNGSLMFLGGSNFKNLY